MASTIMLRIIVFIASIQFPFIWANMESSQWTENQSCPCIAREHCPRIYGQSDLDVFEFGEMGPCLESNTVRCCGVSVCVVILSFFATFALPNWIFASS